MSILSFALYMLPIVVVSYIDVICVYSNLYLKLFIRLSARFKAVLKL